LAAVYHWRGKAHRKRGDAQQALSDFNEVMRLRGHELIEDAADYYDLFSDDE
jgi:hypothetical protein